MGVGALIGAFVFGGAALIAGGTLSIFGMSLGLWQALMMGASLGSLFDTPSFNVQSPNYSLNPVTNTTSQIIPVPVVYGRVRVAGNVFYQQFEDNTKKVLYQHVGLSEGPIKGVGTSDVMVNDFTTAELSTIVKEVFLGTGDQAASANDPEGCCYPYTAYVALKMEASEKLRGTPTVTTVLSGRDIDYPSKGTTAVYMKAATEASAGDYFDEYSGSWGYKDGTVSVDAVGWDWEWDEWYEDWQSNVKRQMTFLLDAVSQTGITQVFCIPWTFLTPKKSDSKSYWSMFLDVFPDKDVAGTYHRFSISTREGSGWKGMDFTKRLSNGVAIHWEVRRVGSYKPTLLEEFSVNKGVLYIKIPAGLVPAVGVKGKVSVSLTGHIQLPHGPWMHGQGLKPGVVPIGCLVPYTDILEDSPWIGFDDVGYNSVPWCAFDYLTNTRYGAGIPEAFFDVDSFAEVAERCLVEGITLNIVVDAQRPTVDVLKDILAPARAFLVARDKIRLKMDAPVSVPQKAISANDIIEGSFSYGIMPADQIPNRVTVEYVDGDEDSPDGCTWERTSYTVEDWDDIMERGVYEKRVSLMGITHKAQAKAMCNYLFEQARRCRTFCSFATTLRNSDIEVGDVLAITFDLPGWVEKWMRVIGVEDGPDCTVAIKCIEYDPVVYDTSDDV